MIKVVCIALAVVIAPAPMEPPHYTESGAASKYDTVFRKYSKRFFGPGFDWRLFKAQAMAESSMNPNAVSPVGARGLMQLMPSTYLEIRSNNAGLGEINDPEWNIAAGIYHDRQLWNDWEKDAQPAHRREFTLGSYNAGRATLQRAQKVAQERALEHRTWPGITFIAPQVPRWKYQETLGYVLRIQDNLSRMDRDGRIH